MTLGPIEIVVIGFESGTFTGDTGLELRKLVDAGTIRIVDGVCVRRLGDGDLAFVELGQGGEDDGGSPPAGVRGRIDRLVSGAATGGGDWWGHCPDRGRALRASS